MKTETEANRGRGRRLDPTYLDVLEEEIRQRRSRIKGLRGRIRDDMTAMCSFSLDCRSLTEGVLQSVLILRSAESELETLLDQVQHVERLKGTASGASQEAPAHPKAPGVPVPE